MVIGGGTMGTAVAWALAKRDVPARVLEQFHHIHPFGSHRGRTRVHRHACADGAHAVSLVLRADELWCELEAESGHRLLHRTGTIELALPGFVHVPQAARDAAAAYGLPFEWLSGAEVRHRWPAWTIPDDWEGLCEARSGFLVVETAFQAMATAARRLGTEIHEEEPVREWRANGTGVTIRTDKATYHTDRLVIAAGSWTGKLLTGMGLPLTVLHKVLWWLAVEEPALFTPDRFPVFAFAAKTGNVYGLPIFEHPGLKLAEHIGGQAVDPDHVNRVACDEEKSVVVPIAREAFRGVTDTPLESLVCLYTMTPDEDFVIDRHPEWPQVVFATGFSGHGFKFAPAIGEHLADLALNSATAPFPQFAIERFRGAAST